MTTNSETVLEPELLTLKQAAQLCGVGERSLWRYSRSGLAPKPVKFGSSKQAATRYRLQDLRQWIDAGCKPVNQET
jgi:predicted DNA-binding transcriptional regulator AlpA